MPLIMGIRNMFVAAGTAYVAARFLTFPGAEQEGPCRAHGKCGLQGHGSVAGSAGGICGIITQFWGCSLFRSRR